jgi:hypothetical protein
LNKSCLLSRPAFQQPDSVLSTIRIALGALMLRKLAVHKTQFVMVPVF